jgi:serine palmitoyltransferase
VVKHQRLYGQAFTFSASLPAILTVTAIEGLNALRKSGGSLMKDIKDNSILFRGIVKQASSKIIIHDGPEESPLFHIMLAHRMADRFQEDKVLQEIVDNVTLFNCLILGFQRWRFLNPIKIYLKPGKNVSYSIYKDLYFCRTFQAGH